MDRFLFKLLLIYLTALGVVIGASLIGSMAAIVANDRPIRTMIKIAEEIKIWALVAAIGGTFSSIEIFETSIFQGEFSLIVKQLFYIISAFAGAHSGYILITNMAGGK